MSSHPDDRSGELAPTCWRYGWVRAEDYVRAKDRIPSRTYPDISVGHELFTLLWPGADHWDAWFTPQAYWEKLGADFFEHPCEGPEGSDVAEWHITTVTQRADGSICCMEWGLARWQCVRGEVAVLGAADGIALRAVIIDEVLRDNGIARRFVLVTGLSPVPLYQQLDAMVRAQSWGRHDSRCWHTSRHTRAARDKYLLAQAAGTTRKEPT